MDFNDGFDEGYQAGHIDGIEDTIRDLKDHLTQNWRARVLVTAARILHPHPTLAEIDPATNHDQTLAHDLIKRQTWPTPEHDKDTTK